METVQPTRQRGRRLAPPTTRGPPPANPPHRGIELDGVLAIVAAAWIVILLGIIALF